MWGGGRGEEWQLFGKRDDFCHILSLAFKVKDKSETNDTASKLQNYTFSVFCYTASKRSHCLLKANLIFYTVSVMKLSSQFLSPFY